ncbi:MAG: helix-turn-helix transcriptional regulator [Vagococcus sp.]|uniref:helix-turn-helix domain-containing protein n=1 Tax=Vagococcus sp. TaxID=1933889 RepID=UPI002FC80746
MESLGEAIKAGRLKKNMTQQELAEDICTQATISNIEKAGKVPAITLLLAIAGRLDIDIDELYYLMGENITKNSKIMKKVKLLCSQSNHKEASDLLKEFNESDLQSIKEKKEYYYYKGITSLVAFHNFSDALFYFNLSNDAKGEDYISIYDVLGLSGVSIAYSMNDEDEKALVFTERTLKILDEFVAEGYDKIDTNDLVRTYFNSAKIYSKTKNYEKAVSLSSMGIALQQLEDSMSGLEYLMYEKAYNLQQLEQVTEAENFYFYAAAIAMLNKNKEVLETVKSDMKLYKVPHYMY